MSDYQEPEWPRVQHPALVNPYPIGSVGNPIFASARAKLRRVGSVCDSLKVEAEGLRLDHIEGTVVTLSEDRGTYRFSIGQQIAIPQHWSVIFGELLYDMRSSLDHAAFELSQLSLDRELTRDKAWQSQFLITTDKASYWEKAESRFPGVPEDALRMIERVQPFPGRDADFIPTLFDQAAFFLGLLNKLGNIEKHRYPHLMIYSVSGGSWWWEHPEPTVFEGFAEVGRIFAEMPYYPEYVPYVSRQPSFQFAPRVIHAGERGIFRGSSRRWR